MTDASGRYATAEEEVDIERVRLDMLAAVRDPSTFEVLDRVGIGPGMRVLEVGAGAGTVSAWMADRVGGPGQVLSTDIDLQFHAEMPSNVEVRRHDIERDPLPDSTFDIVHARAVLQHVPEREAVIPKLIASLKPGGWLVLEDGQFTGFGAQGLAEPYRSIHQIMAAGSQQDWRDPDFGLQLLDRMRGHGLVDLDVTGDVWAMRAGEPSGEWWFLALERAIPRLVAAGITTEADAAAALDQVRAPGFVMISPVSMATVGRKPA
ncbi:MAG: methyltransferase domain-containing protein [Acidimicrobiales bacterium]|nr:methyltransferase domain-containing protein [Acidimicrobiales bacterium]